MSDRQCPSCGGICRKSGCERANLDAEWDIRGTLASALKCWHRLTGEEAAELVAFVAALQSAQPTQEPLRELTEPQVHGIAYRKATRYTYIAKPSEVMYGFSETHIVDFVRAIEKAMG